MRLIGPNCPGVLSPGKANVGIIPAQFFDPGKIGVVSKSGTLTYQIGNELKQAGEGNSSIVGIGGDPIVGSDFIDILTLFEADPETELIVMVGEIGGDAEERAAEFIEAEVSKPVVAYIAGFTAPPGKQMGHAGAIISGSSGTAQAKKEALEAKGVRVGESPTEAAQIAVETLRGSSAGAQLSRPRSDEAGTLQATPRDARSVQSAERRDLLAMRRRGRRRDGVGARRLRSPTRADGTVSASKRARTPRSARFRGRRAGGRGDYPGRELAPTSSTRPRTRSAPIDTGDQCVGRRSPSAAKPRGIAVTPTGSSPTSPTSATARLGDRHGDGRGRARADRGRERTGRDRDPPDGGCAFVARGAARHRHRRRRTSRGRARCPTPSALADRDRPRRGRSSPTPPQLGRPPSAPRRGLVGAPISVGAQPPGSSSTPMAPSAYAASPDGNALTRSTPRRLGSARRSGFPARRRRDRADGSRGYVTDGWRLRRSRFDTRRCRRRRDRGRAEAGRIAIVPDQADGLVLVPPSRRQARLTFHAGASRDPTARSPPTPGTSATAAT